MSALQVIDAFGLSLDRTYLLASPRGEWFLPTGRISPSARTFVLALEGRSVRLVAVVPEPLNGAWASENGTVYCATRSGEVLVVQGDWSKPEREVVGPGTMQRSLWGLSGERAEEDALFMGGTGAFYVRRGRSWQRVAAPPHSGKILGCHGLAADPVYCASELGILLWDGHTLSLWHSPDDVMRAVFVVSAQEILATGLGVLYRWSGGTEWYELSEGTSPWKFARLRDELYGIDDDRVLRIDDAPRAVAALPDAFGLQSVGDGLVALSSQARSPLVFDGHEWQPLVMPSCEPGKLPG